MIRLRTRYLCVVGDARGLVFTVVATGSFVTAWSDPVGNGHSIGGFTWRGPVERFASEFEEQA